MRTRRDTLDEYVIREQPRYLKRLTLRPDDVALDAGAHIGSFASLVAPHVAEVHCFEPEPANFALLEANTALLGNVRRYRAALITTDSPTAELYLNAGQNTGSHSMVVKRGREALTIPAENFTRVLARLNPTLVKMDVEGAEYVLVPAAGAWGRVRELVLEYHFQALRDNDWSRFRETKQLLRQEGFELQAPEVQNKARHALLYGKR